MSKIYNIDQMYYYYLRDDKKQPMVTVCVVRIGSNYARGVSICSPYDQPNKKLGRKYARDRALFSIFNRSITGYISRNEANHVLCIVDNNNFMYKAEFNPKLTVFEKVLFGLIERNIN